MSRTARFFRREFFRRPESQFLALPAGRFTYLEGLDYSYTVTSFLLHFQLNIVLCYNKIMYVKKKPLDSILVNWVEVETSSDTLSSKQKLFVY